MQLSEQQLRQYQQEGYLRLPNFVPPLLLQQLQALFDELMYHTPGINDRAVNEVKGIVYTESLENVCSKGNLAALELLGCPAVLELAAQICGPDFFMIQEFAVIKMLGNTTTVLWHQDMLHERTGQCFTMGIYLDEAASNDGALRVVPGSHTSGKDICTLQHEPFVEQPMQAGDVLIHDMMLAHSSPPMQQRSLRRVLYFEFLSVQQVLQENIYTSELVQNRLQLLRLAMQHYAQQHPGEPGFNWQNNTAAQQPPVADLAAALGEVYARPVNARPSAYCFSF